MRRLVGRQPGAEGHEHGLGLTCVEELTRPQMCRAATFVGTKTRGKAGFEASAGAYPTDPLVKTETCSDMNELCELCAKKIHDRLAVAAGSCKNRAPLVGNLQRIMSIWGRSEYSK